jgi:hypothetical protein
MNEKRGNLYLISGFVIGLLFGLIYSWLLDPVEFIDAAPVSLSAEYKDQYRELIAMAYGANADMGRAQARLALLQEEDQLYVLGAQAQKLQGDTLKIREARAVMKLGEDLQALMLTGPMLVAGTPLAEAPTAEPGMEVQTTPGVGAEPTTPAVSTEQATMAAEQPGQAKNEGLFQLDQQMEVCDPNLPQGLLQVVVLDAQGTPIPGVRGTVYWAEGNDYFYTGLYPDLGDGYGDYVMKATVEYKLQIGDGTTMVESVTPPVCTADNGKQYFGSQWMQFKKME